jgi:hypothetical protein
MLHELGHHVEAHNPNVVEAERAFYEARTAGEEKQRLVDIFPGFGYRKNEETRPDDFAHAYTGKDYGGGDAYEVLTMGLEALFFSGGGKDVVPTEDPGHLNWMLGLLITV